MIAPTRDDDGAEDGTKPSAIRMRNEQGAPCTNWLSAQPRWEKDGKTKGDKCGIVVVAQGNKAQKDETEVSSFFVGDVGAGDRHFFATIHLSESVVRNSVTCGGPYFLVSPRK